MLDILRGLLGVIWHGGFGLLCFIVLALFVLSGLDSLWKPHR